MIELIILPARGLVAKKRGNPGLITLVEGSTERTSRKVILYSNKGSEGHLNLPDLIKLILQKLKASLLLFFLLIF